MLNVATIAIDVLLFDMAGACKLVPAGADRETVIDALQAISDMSRGGNA